MFPSILVSSLRAMFLLSNSYEAWHGWPGNWIFSQVLGAATESGVGDDGGKKED